MKITKSYLRQVIREEIEKVDEIGAKEIGKVAGGAVSAVVPGADLAQRLFKVIMGDKEVAGKVKKSRKAKSALQQLARALGTADN